MKRPHCYRRHMLKIGLHALPIFFQQIPGAAWGKFLHPVVRSEKLSWNPAFTLYHLWKAKTATSSRTGLYFTSGENHCSNQSLPFVWIQAQQVVPFELLGWYSRPLLCENPTSYWWPFLRGIMQPIHMYHEYSGIWLRHVLRPSSNQDEMCWCPVHRWIVFSNRLDPMSSPSLGKHYLVRIFLAIHQLSFSSIAWFHESKSTHRKQPFQFPHFRCWKCHHCFHFRNGCYLRPHTGTPQGPDQKMWSWLLSHRLFHRIFHNRRCAHQYVHIAISNVSYLCHKYTLGISPFVSSQDTNPWFLGKRCRPIFSFNLNIYRWYPNITIFQTACTFLSTITNAVTASLADFVKKRFRI